MSTFLLLVLVIAVVILVLAVTTLAGRVKNATTDLESLRLRLAQVEARLSEWTRGTPPAETEAARYADDEGAEIPPLASAVQELPAAAKPAEGWRISAEPPPLPPLITPAPDSGGWQAGHGGTFVAPGTASPLPPAEEKPAWPISWEQFMGAKLFAWVGGFVLFLGIAFFIKYSFEHNLIPPAVRAAAGFAAGLGLLVGGILLKRRELAVTSQTLCATGVLVLYAVTFTCRSVYRFEFFGQVPTFILMVMITATAFSLAVRLEALVVAILGMVGGFLTPIVLSSGEDNPLGLFSYIALLDFGLLAVAFRRRWHFLILLGAIGTALMQLGWVISFFTPGKVFIAMAVFLGFDLLFLLAFLAGEKLRQTNQWLSAAAAGLPFGTLAFATSLVVAPALGGSPGTVFTFVFGADLCLLAIVFLQPSLQRIQAVAGMAVFALLAAWMTQHLSADRLFWALGLCLMFALLHTAFPAALARFRPQAPPDLWSQLFPPLSLVLMLLPLVKLEPISMMIWPAVLLVDALAIGLALLTASVISVLLVMLLTVAATAIWLLRMPVGIDSLPSMLVIIGGFGLFFFVSGVYAALRLSRRSEPAASADTLGQDLQSVFGVPLAGPVGIAQVPALSAILPFLLLIMVTVRLPLANPTPVFGLALVLVGLLLGLAVFGRSQVLPAVGLICVLALQSVWHQSHFNPGAPWVALVWSLVFYSIFTVFPFLFRDELEAGVPAWATSALAGPLHYYLVRDVVTQSFGSAALGLLPAAFAVPMLLALRQVHATFPPGSARLSLLAWYGGSALFFITLIIPTQFERQWITIGWALEGLALLWLFHRVPHPGLRATGVVLLGISFFRLALNPAVFEYHPSSSLKILNWYLYAYGIVTVCLMLGGRLLRPPRHLVWNWNMPPVLYTLGTVLAFLLLNIEIADYFAEGAALTFQFSGNFARDMVYSIGWAVFALILLVSGIWRQLPGARYAALALLTVTLLKLFIHDLSQLGQLHRIGAFVAVAVILIFASFLYQRFVTFGPVKPK